MILLSCPYMQQEYKISTLIVKQQSNTVRYVNIFNFNALLTISTDPRIAFRCKIRIMLLILNSSNPHLCRRVFNVEKQNMII